MNNEHMIAKRYATAFLNLFPFSADILEQIKEAVVFLDQHDEVFLMLKIPLLDPSHKEQALENYLIHQFKLPDTFKKLISLLIHQKRSYLIKDVLRLLIELYEEKTKVEFFEIKSAVPLDDESTAIIQDFLTHKTHHTIITRKTLDERLIAGIRVQSSQHLWEYSIRKHLAAIQRELNE